MHPEIDVITTNRFTDANVADSDIVIDWGFPDIMADAERLTQELVVPVCSPSICPDRTLAGVPLVHRHDLPSPLRLSRLACLLTGCWGGSGRSACRPPESTEN